MGFPLGCVPVDEPCGAGPRALVLHHQLHPHRGLPGLHGGHDPRAHSQQGHLQVQQGRHRT